MDSVGLTRKAQVRLMFGLSWSDTKLRLDSCLDSVGLTPKAQIRLMFGLSLSDSQGSG